MLRYHLMRRHYPERVPARYQVRFIPRKGPAEAVMTRVSLVPRTGTLVLSLSGLTGEWTYSIDSIFCNSAVRFRELFEQASTAMVIIDHQRMIIRVNAWAEQFFGRMKAQSGNTLHWTDLVTPAEWLAGA